MLVAIQLAILPPFSCGSTTSQTGLPRAAGSREAVYGGDVTTGGVGGVTVEEAVGCGGVVCVGVAERLPYGFVELIWWPNYI